MCCVCRLSRRLAAGAGTRMRELVKEPVGAELSGSPRRPKTSGPGDVPDEPGPVAAGGAEQGTTCAAREAKSTKARPKKTRRLGRINGGFMPVNRVVPAVKDPEQATPDVVEPGLASWNRSQEHVAESLALQAQPRGGWKRPRADQPVGAPSAAAVTEEPQQAVQAPASAAAAAATTGPRAHTTNFGLPS
eukprot:COSAG02_NODE_26150_length_639_cov_1.916667_1_plen_189_part_10